jgi:tetratricopeptide (TPR) repeat protein
MNRSVRVLAVLAVLAVMLSAAGCNKLKARDQLNKGVQAYKNQNYEQAIEHFKNAINDDPQLLNAKIYLATAYDNQFVPGNDDKANLAYAQLAIDEFKAVLASDPKNTAAEKGIASIYFNMKKFDEAKTHQRNVIAIDPNDPEAYYTIGVIDWTQSYGPRQEIRNGLHMKPTDSITDKKACATVRAKNSANVEDGLTVLQKAIQLRSDYEDAMAYLNLMYRERADYECEDKDARADDLKKADEWQDKTLATKKEKEDKANQQAGGIVMDKDKEQEKQ